MRLRSSYEPDLKFRMALKAAKKIISGLGSVGLLLGVLAAAESPMVFRTQSDLYRFLEKKRTFEFDLDQDLNKFPDDWFIEEGPKFETYHRIELSKEGYQDTSSLNIAFSGGQAGIFSAPLVLEKRYAYNLSLFYRSEGLEAALKHRIHFGLRAYGKNNKILQTYHSEESAFGPSWTKSAILRIETLPAGTESCVLFMHLSGRPAGSSRLFVDQFKVEATPRIQFSTGQALNTFGTDQDVSFSQTIDGTEEGKTYEHVVEIKDFMGHLIGTVEKNKLQGSLEAQVKTKKITPSLPGVYYVHAQLLSEDKVLVDFQEIVAKDTSVEKNFSNTDFGVLIGHPKTPFEPMVNSMSMLGTSLSKLELFKDDFSLAAYSKDKGLDTLNPLLRRLAPDLGYHFIAVLNQVPQDSIEDKYQPPQNVVETFAKRDKIWTAVLDDLVLKYGNVFSDWQLGQDSQMIKDAELESGSAVISHLRNRASWMKIVVPGANSASTMEGYLQNLYIPWDMKDEQLEKLLNLPGQKSVNVTLQLAPNEKISQLKIIEDLVRRITTLKAAKDQDGQALVSRLFIDRLNGPSVGLMTENYEPHSSYFAAKTLIYWMKGARVAGSFQNPDHDVVNRVFVRGNQAFCILWRASSNVDGKVIDKEVTYHLGKGVKVMDLMGNEMTPIENSDKLRVSVGSTPLFLITPYPALWETMLSVAFQQKDLMARVQLQKQTVSMRNYFNKQAKFDILVNYPSDWEVLTPRYSCEIIPRASASHNFLLSPSTLFPLNLGVPVYVDMDISLADQHHVVKVYREDSLSSDVKLGVSFFKDPQGLKMDIRLDLAATVTKASTFLVSAQLPNGNIVETFFKTVQPGEKRQNSLFILNGESLIGGEVVLTARESIGQRYLNASFPIKPVF